MRHTSPPAAKPPAAAGCAGADGRYGPRRLI